jgi:multisubunit Na+/H+ antiporter MnhG subunit
MNPEIVKELKPGIWPTILLILFIIGSVGILSLKDQMSQISSEAALINADIGVTILMLGIVVWIVTWKLEEVRADLAEMKKQP